MWMRGPMRLVYHGQLLKANRMRTAARSSSILNVAALFFQNSHVASEQVADCDLSHVTQRVFLRMCKDQQTIPTGMTRCISWDSTPSDVTYAFDSVHGFSGMCCDGVQLQVSA